MSETDTLAAATSGFEMPILRDLDDPDFDPFRLDEIAFADTDDPYPKLRELRQQSWIHPHAYRTFFTDVKDQALGRFPHYTVFGYDQTQKFLLQPENFTNEALKHSLGIGFGKTISGMDAPEHTRYRRIFQKAFLPNIVRSWGDTLVEPVVQALIGKFMDRGKADLVQEFTLHYPFQIIYRQLALPEQDTKLFHKLAVTQTLHTVDAAHAAEAGAKLGAYFTPIVEERRKHPGDDLISLMATAEAEGEMLPTEIVVSFLRQLINAGGDTTYRGTSALLTALLSNPDQLEMVRNDRSLVPHAIDEALRWEGPVIVTRRMVARDMEIDGVKLIAGSVVDVAQGSGNRDETKFANPDVYDIRRPRPIRHLAFGAGPHICIGQHLAKVEMDRALNAVLDKLPNLRLDPDMPPPDIRGFSMRVPKHISVRFGD